MAVGSAELLVAFAGLRNFVDEFPVDGVAQHPAGAVAVADEDFAVGGEGDVGGNEADGLGVVGGIGRRVAGGPNDFAGERGLHDFAAGGVTVIEELVAALFADAEAVGAAAEFFTEGADEFALGIVNDDGLGAHRRGVDGVGDVDEALAVLGQTVGVAPDEALWLGQPVVDHLVSVRAGAGDQGSRAGLRLGADEGGGD